MDEICRPEVVSYSHMEELDSKSTADNMGNIET